MANKVIMPLTPIWGSKPEYAALQGSTGNDDRPTGPGEYAEFILYLNGKPYWSSGLVSVYSLTGTEHPIRLPVGRNRLSLFLRYTRYVNQFPYTVRVGVNLPRREYFNGTPFVVIRPSRATYPPIAIARRRVSYAVERIRPARTSFPRSSPLRPSPEIRVTSVRKTTENVDDRGVYTVVNDTVVPVTVYRRSWSGVRTPNFGRLKKSQYPINSHHCEIANISINRLIYGTRRNTGAPDYTARVTSYTDVNAEPSMPVHLPQARNVAIRKLTSNANVGIDANLAQDVAQANQLFDLMATSVNRITGAVTNLRRGNIPGVISAFSQHGRRSGLINRSRPSAQKTLADNWLEFQYGWKPLLMDIDGILDALGTLAEKSPFVRRVTASAKQRGGYVDFTPSLYAGSVAPGLQIKTKVKIETRCKICCTFRLNSALRSFMAQTGFTNPINLVWEILPFSFVVDWFLPVGAYLQGITAFEGWDFNEGYQTQFTRGWTDSAVDSEGTSQGNNIDDYWIHQRLYRESVLLDRDRLGAFPTQTLPGFKNPFESAIHAWNAIALLKSVF